MKTLTIVLSGIAILLFSSFAPSEACNYASSNLNHVKTQTEKALSMNTINEAKFYAYQAIKAIQNSTNQFEDCGCKDASITIDESLINLKAATKSKSINGARILLKEALKQIIDSHDALNQHEMHDTVFSSKEFALNTSVSIDDNSPTDELKTNDLYLQIDKSLINYSKSINEVVISVNCKDAREFANKIFLNCEQQLLQSDLSEGKKYYNLRTKEITAKALMRIGDCEI